MIFLNPSYLWALLGLAVPLAIHLWSRKEGRTIKIGSVQFLSEKDPKRSSSIKLNELFLLFLRMLIISLLVFIIAEPRLPAKTEISPVTYLVEPSLLLNKQVTNILDTIDPDAVRLLQPGFPEYKNINLEDSLATPNYWQLAGDMDNLKTDSIVVFTRAYATGLKGKRPQIRKNINWIVLDPGDTQRTLVKARKNADEVVLTIASGDHLNLKFEEKRLSLNSEAINLNKTGDSISITSEGKLWHLPLKSTDSIKVLLVHNDSLDNEVQILQATYNAIGNYLDLPVEVKVVGDENFPEVNNTLSSIIWLSGKPVIKTTVPSLIYRPDSLANSLVERTSIVNQYYLTRPLNSEIIMEEQLPEKLLALLRINSDVEEHLPKYDKRVADIKELQPVYSEGVSEKRITGGTDFSKYLWIMLLVVILAERGLAYIRKQ